MTTSSSLPYNLTDNKMGMGLRFQTVTFLRIFNLGRWEAMTLPASACEEVDTETMSLYESQFTMY